MKFVYAPEGADPREWDFEPNKIPAKDAELIERRTGMHFGDWLDAVNAGSMLAYHALLFIYMRRDNQALQWDQLDFNFSEVGIKLSDDEVRDRLIDLERRARKNTLDEREGRMLAALRDSTTAGELDTIRADLDREENPDPGPDPRDGDPEDPPSSPSEPESAPGDEKPAKAAKKKP